MCVCLYVYIEGLCGIYSLAEKNDAASICCKLLAKDTHTHTHTHMHTHTCIHIHTERISSLAEKNTMMLQVSVGHC